MVAAMTDSAVLHDTPYEALGGAAGRRRLTDAFYDRMDRDPAFEALRLMHAADLGPMRERLADWMSGWTGGPAVYAQNHPGRPCIVSAHAPFRIDAAVADQWLACMRAALDAVSVSAQWRGPLDDAFARMCTGLQNVGPEPA